VNSIAPEPLKGFERKLTKVFPILGPQTLLRFQSNGFKGQGHRSVFRRRHTDRRLAVDSCLVSRCQRRKVHDRPPLSDILAVAVPRNLYDFE